MVNTAFIIRKCWFVVLFIKATILMPATCEAAFFVPRKIRFKANESGMLLVVKFREKFKGIVKLFSTGMVRVVNVEQAQGFDKLVSEGFASFLQLISSVTVDIEPISDKNTEQRKNSSQSNITNTECQLVCHKILFFMYLFFCETLGRNLGILII